MVHFYPLQLFNNDKNKFLIFDIYQFQKIEKLFK